MKKLAVIGGGALLLGALLFGGAKSYLWLAYDKTAEFVNELEGTEMKIERMESMIKHLDPAIADATRKVAREEVEVEMLSERVGELTGKLDKSKADIQRLTADLESGNATFVYAGKSYDQAEVKRDLERRFELHKSQQETADRLTELKETRGKAVGVARQTLEDMKAQKEQFKAVVATLRSRVEQLRLKEQQSQGIEIDNSLFSEIKSLEKDIDTRIRVGEKLVAGQADTTVGEIVLDQPEAQSDILDRVTKYFGSEAGQNHGVVINLD